MSAIAQVLHERGVRVTGSDLKDSRYARALADMGIEVRIGHSAENLKDPEIVVVSSAIPDSNPELSEARRRGLPVWPRAKMLAHLAEDRKTIAVAGTHGKTTTSSMIASMCAGMGLDPTFLIGGELNDMGANARCGAGDLYVVEADESDGSFLHLSPDIAVVTNIEADHLDHYTGINDVTEAFCEFVARVPEDGSLVVWGDDPRAEMIASRCLGRVVTYGEGEACAVRCAEIMTSPQGASFRVTFPDGREVTAELAVLGHHNALNATGALAVAWLLGCDVTEAAAAVSVFSGVRRRFEDVGEGDGVRVVDDYAHHPTEVRATIAAARGAGHERVWVVFQPHRYSRTQALGSDFGRSFVGADRVVLMEVYGAGETPIPGVSGKTVLDAALAFDPRSRVAYFPHRADVTPFLRREVRRGDLVITMGAGDVTTLGPELARSLAERETSGA